MRDKRADQVGKIDGLCLVKIVRLTCPTANIKEASPQNHITTRQKGSKHCPPCPVTEASLSSAWKIPSAVFVLVVAIQAIFSFSSKFLKNPGSMPKTSTYVLSTSRKHMTGFLMKSSGECCGSTVLTAACYWPSKSLYSCSEVCVYVGEVKSQQFTVGVGLRQWSVLSQLIAKFVWIESTRGFPNFLGHGGPFANRFFSRTHSYVAIIFSPNQRKVCVRVGGVKSQQFNVGVGLWQLPTLFFIVYGVDR